MRDNPLHLALDGSNPLELLTQESRELGREVDHPALIVLRGPWIQAEGARLNVELAALELRISWTHQPYVCAIVTAVWRSGASRPRTARYGARSKKRDPTMLTWVLPDEDGAAVGDNVNVVGQRP
jgi:hypothetical protein